jgi:hypothetical protein
MSVLLAADVLAKSGEAAKSGPLGFAVILVLCVACYFLFKSMSRHLKTVRQQFPAEPGAGDAGRTETRAETRAEEPASPAASEASAPAEDRPQP